MNTGKLIPGVSTHFRCIGATALWHLTYGKVYQILEWEGVSYYFLNDKGERKRWFQHGVVDASYEENLKEILE